MPSAGVFTPSWMEPTFGMPARTSALIPGLIPRATHTAPSTGTTLGLAPEPLARSSSQGHFTGNMCHLARWKLILSEAFFWRDSRLGIQ
jgi:hypothetical protein